MKIIVGISGASGADYGIRALEALRDLNVETHLVITDAAKRVIKQETDYDIDYVESLATEVHRNEDLGASIASGSFKTDGMAIVPCSMKTLGGLASGYSQNLLLRAADVVMKEGRRLVLVPRETPLNIIHLENMLKLARIGVFILPASPPFYNRPKTINDLVSSIAGRVLDLLDIENKLYARWGEGPRWKKT